MKEKQKILMASLRETLSEIAKTLRVMPLWQGLMSPFTGLCFLLGLIGLFMPSPSYIPNVFLVFLAAFLEEIVFRVLLQSQLEQSYKGSYTLKLGAYSLEISKGCLSAALIFAAMHIVNQSLFMSVLIFFPALVFGVLWTRHRSAWLCTLMHFWYNAVLYYF